MSGYQAAVDRVQRVVVEDFVLSQEDKPKRIDQLVRFRVKLPFSVQLCTGYFTVISSSNVSNDVVFSCCLKPIASLVSLADNQPYRLQLILLLFSTKPKVE